jgi:hypothetical protein
MQLGLFHCCAPGIVNRSRYYLLIRLDIHRIAHIIIIIITIFFDEYEKTRPPFRHTENVDVQLLFELDFVSNATARTCPLPRVPGTFSLRITEPVSFFIINLEYRHSTRLLPRSSNTRNQDEALPRTSSIESTSCGSEALKRQ